MCNKTLVIFPHQLFDNVQDLATRHGACRVLLWDDPVFYGDRRGSSYGVSRLRLNWLRIIYQRALLLRFAERHLGAGVGLEWVRVEDLWSLKGSRSRYQRLRGERDLVLMDPADHLLLERMRRAGVIFEMVDSPMFLTSREDLEAWRERTKGHTRLQQAPFYKWVKGKLGLLEGVGSMDRMNRKPWPKGARDQLPAEPAVPARYMAISAGERSRIWAEAAKWASQMSRALRPRGQREVDPEMVGRLPLDSGEVGGWFRDFLDRRFASFGPYEDAIVEGSPWLFHSGLSAFMNFGLITPATVLAGVKDKFEHLSRGAAGAMASYEGFVRQVAGWREYARLYYELVNPEVVKRNIFGMKLASQAEMEKWCRAGTGVPLVDSAIADAFKWGYLHHIRRLMVMSNAMTLGGLHPDQVYAWMYEFSLDSWEWVMVFNVYSMGTWSDGGFGMRKPYISSSGYLKKMSSEALSAEERAWWDEKYASFVKKHREILKHTVLARRLRE